MGEGAGGVSTHSKFSSEVLLLILHLAVGILQTRSAEVLRVSMAGGELI